MPKLNLRTIALLFSIIFLMLCHACAYYIPANMPFEAALDGPPLALYGKAGEREFEGSIDRGIMVGFGSMQLSETKRIEGGFSCSGNIDLPPSPKNRVYGILECSDQSNLLIVLRNMGPDQGFILASIYTAPDENYKEGKAGDPLLLFYHPSMDEAKRRLPVIEESFTQLIKEFPNLQDSIYNKLKIIKQINSDNLNEAVQEDADFRQ